MKYKLFILFILSSWSSYGQDIVSKDTMTIFSAGTFSMRATNIDSMPNDEFLRMDTIKGVVRTINKDGIEKIIKASKILKVYKHWYKEYPSPMFSPEGYTYAVYQASRKVTKEINVLDAIIAYGRLIDLNKWYEFIPENQLQ